jgi:hypothetical protein
LLSELKPEMSYVEASWKRQKESHSVNRRGWLRCNDSIVIGGRLGRGKSRRQFESLSLRQIGLMPPR